MPLTVHYHIQLSGSTVRSADNIKAYVSDLLPSPLPLDLKVTATPPHTLSLEFSINHPDADAAADAIIKAFNSEAPT